MTPVQILRAVLKCLSEERTFKPSYFMERVAEGSSPSPPPPLNFRGSAEVIFVEPSGWLNIAAHASKAALIQVRQYSALFRGNSIACASSWISCPLHVIASSDGDVSRKRTITYWRGGGSVSLKISCDPPPPLPRL